MKQIVSCVGIILLTVLSMMFTGCWDSDGSSSNNVPDYGGSIPRGDYVTAVIEGSQVTIKNMTQDTKESLNFSDFDGIGASIIKKTEPDADGNFYYMALVEDQVLGMQKMDADDNPIGLPIYMFSKAKLTAADVRGRAFNYMEFYASDNAAVEIGLVGFDTDASGTLYGAAFTSDGNSYSITDEDGISDSGDEFSLDLTEEQSDGSLVLWENGFDNWAAATTLTGTAAGPVVMDHGPQAGGGAGFALPQVTETDPDTFWSIVSGDYFLIYYDKTIGVEFYKCTVDQTAAGSWAGQATIYSLEDDSVVRSVNITELQDASKNAIENLANFSNAQSAVVQNASDGKGIFQEDVVDPDFIMAFDPDGSYIGIADLASAAFAVGIRDPNWQ